MDLDRPEHASMNIDEGVVSPSHSQPHDSTDALSGSDRSHLSPAYHPGVDVTTLPYRPITPIHLPRPPRPHLLSLPEVMSRKRQRSPADSSPSRRTRPRVRTQWERDLVSSPRESPEETTSESVFHYPQSGTNASSSIQHYLPLGYAHERSSLILRSSISPTDSGTGSGQEPGRSDSAESYAQVALASLTNSTITPALGPSDSGCLPCPLVDVGSGLIKVHERGIDAIPSISSTPSVKSLSSLSDFGCLPRPFADVGSAVVKARQRMPSTRPGHRTGDLGGSHSRAASPRMGTAGHPFADAPSLESDPTNVFDEPICDSPASISPNEDRLARR